MLVLDENLAADGFGPRDCDLLAGEDGRQCGLEVAGRRFRAALAVGRIGVVNATPVGHGPVADNEVGLGGDLGLLKPRPLLLWVEDARASHAKIQGMLCGLLGGEIRIGVDLEKEHALLLVLPRELAEGGLIEVGDRAVHVDEDQHGGLGPGLCERIVFAAVEIGEDRVLHRIACREEGGEEEDESGESSEHGVSD